MWIHLLVTFWYKSIVFWFSHGRNILLKVNFMRNFLFCWHFCHSRVLVLVAQYPERELKTTLYSLLNYWRSLQMLVDDHNNIVACIKLNLLHIWVKYTQKTNIRRNFFLFMMINMSHLRKISKLVSLLWGKCL